MDTTAGRLENSTAGFLAATKSGNLIVASEPAPVHLPRSSAIYPGASAAPGLEPNNLPESAGARQSTTTARDVKARMTWRRYSITSTLKGSRGQGRGGDNSSAILLQLLPVRPQRGYNAREGLIERKIRHNHKLPCQCSAAPTLPQPPDRTLKICYRKRCVGSSPTFGTKGLRRFGWTGPTSNGNDLVTSPP